MQTHDLDSIGSVCRDPGDAESFFFFNDTATTEIYTLSLHDALPISSWASWRSPSRSSARRSRRWRSTRCGPCCWRCAGSRSEEHTSDSSHMSISYAVFCLKKKKKSKGLVEQDVFSVSLLHLPNRATQ